MSAVGTYPQSIGRFFTRFLLTAQQNGRKQESASGKIRLSGLFTPIVSRRPTAKKPLCGFFMGRTLRAAQAGRFLDAIVKNPFRLARQIFTWRTRLDINQGGSAMTELRKTARQKKMSAIVLENELSDIFDLIKITHQIAVNKDNEMSPYDDDPDRALFASVSFLREKTAAFEALYYGPSEGKS